MGYAKKKKVKVTKIDPTEAFEFLVSRYVLYLRGEEMVTYRGEAVDKTVSWNEDGTFTPSEKGIAETFQFLNNLWVKSVHRNFKRSAWHKYENLFKEAVSREWNASRKQ